MINVGCHVSVTKGFKNMGETTLDLGGDTFAFFIRNPRGGKSKKIEDDDVKALNSIMSDNNFGKIVVHGAYTMNLCSSTERTRQNGFEMLRDDVTTMSQHMAGHYYNFHPGSHTGLGSEKGIELISQGLNEVITEDMPFTILLETMAGKGSEVGRNFEELQNIIGRLNFPDKVGVCFDTCHVWDGGYDIVNNLDGVLEDFDRIIGLDKLKAIHFNDSKNPCGAHKDRHEKLGQGYIGMDAMKRIATHPLLQNKPFILETPNELPGYKEEIQIIKSFF